MTSTMLKLWRPWSASQVLELMCFGTFLDMSGVPDVSVLPQIFVYCIILF